MCKGKIDCTAGSLYSASAPDYVIGMLEHWEAAAHTRPTMVLKSQKAACSSLRICACRSSTSFICIATSSLKYDEPNMSPTYGQEMGCATEEQTQMLTSLALEAETQEDVPASYSRKSGRHGPRKRRGPNCRAATSGAASCPAASCTPSPAPQFASGAIRPLPGGKGR